MERNSEEKKALKKFYEKMETEETMAELKKFSPYLFKAVEAAFLAGYWEGKKIEFEALVLRKD